MKSKKPTTIDEYLRGVPADRRATLEALRRTIHACAPGLEECISYSLPAFRREGHVVAGFLATAKGCSYFPFSGTTLATLAGELRAYDRTKSALHFAGDEPLPKSLVKRLLAARIAETAARPAAKKRPATKARSTRKVAPSAAKKPANKAPRRGARNAAPGRQKRTA